MQGHHNPATAGRAALRQPLVSTAGLGYGQVFVLIFGFLLASGLIFLFGIWVGRDVAERRLAQEERVVRASVPAVPTAGEGTAQPDVDAAFYQQLKEKAYQRMQETAAAGSSTPEQVVEVTTPTRIAARAAVKPTPRPTAVEHAKASATVPRGDDWADAGWTVQVNATTNPQQAADLARGLKSKGYDAYTVQAPMRGQTWYRVRVGRFSSREKAKEMEKRLKTAEGLENAYVTPQ
ncbi:MAG TPA: SPOR domain-containing protein [Candidatus Acidoferrales bacterium]|nr:SPOR domain-containing protein [Candidatus Acidoferrales bacterium]